ncbi:hypothetical protein QAD02_014874 [Eretmocerus hayati]|uniref:Uncharacterized protein n=1 Tax=Eretmocerus hayati TaxID=131215 RepID=A0ACC2P709_9HYME|nr:hypothetical protein QAD02_014874 [Eretmocerus hayati]
MKTIILIFALALFVGVHTQGLTPEQESHIHKSVEGCIEESKVDRQLLEDMKNGKHPTVTRELNCFAYCVLREKGDMDKDGNVFVKPTDSEAAKKCKELKKDDRCDTAGEVMGCFAKNGLIPKRH